MTVNPHNFWPVFTNKQLSASLWATALYSISLHSATIIDTERLHMDIHTTYAMDPVAASHLPTPSTISWSLSEDRLLLLNNRIYILNQNDLCLQVLRKKHYHLLSRHLSCNKTLELIWWEYAWLKMRTFVIDYCKSCVTCGRAKLCRHKPYDLLKQLPVPDFPWHSISMDLIEHLPSSSGYDAILVIINHLLKQGIFIPTHDTLTAVQLTDLFVMYVFFKHRVLFHITSDRGSKFISHFFRGLRKALDMKLHFTSSYHPEGDSQTKHINQTLKQYLRCYCNYQQDNWSSLLSLAEFAYNNTLNNTTSVSPFFANKGYHPNLSIHLERDIASNCAQEFTTNLGELHDHLKFNICDAQLRYQKSAYRNRLLAPDFQIGQKVYIKAQYFRTTCPLKKLSNKYLGPYKIINKASSHSFILWLLDTFCAVHPVYHVSMLEQHPPNTIPNRIEESPPLIEIEGNLEYEIAEILNSKIDHCHHCKLLYLVK